MLPFPKRACPGLAVALLALACGPIIDRNQTAGELGNGAFTYLCVGTDDAVCTKGGKADVFPERIATTATFDVQFEAFDARNISGFDIVTAAAGVIEEENNVFRAVAPHVVALLAKRTSDGRVLDLVHVQVLDVSKIRFESKGQSPSVIWSVGVLQTLRLVPEDGDGAVLAGDLDYDWTTSDPSVVRLDRANPTAEMELFPLKAGSATISVSGGNRTDTLTVTVEGKAGAPPDAGTGVPHGRVEGGREGGVEGGATRVPDGGAPIDSAIADGGLP